MDAKELLDIITSGETSRVQFKETMPNAESMSREFVAMSNSGGGVILLGVNDKTSAVTGVTAEQVKYTDKKIAEYADNLKPPIFVTTEVVRVEEGKRVLVIHIDDGINKPYKTAKGEIYVKQASNKRLLTDNSEIARLFEEGSNLFADQMQVYRTSIDDIRKAIFDEYFEKEFGESYEKKDLTFEEALKSLHILEDNQLTLAGLLFFGKDPQGRRPDCTIKFVNFYGNDLAGDEFRSKPVDLKGTIPQLFDTAIRYLEASLFHLQTEQGFNSKGSLEISKVALIELVQNALLHRSYFKSAPIRIFVFDNRVEIISPGALPNSLTVEDIIFGHPVTRNRQLVVFGSSYLPFSGVGSGIKRALKNQPNIEFINDKEGEQFIVIIPRPPKEA